MSDNSVGGGKENDLLLPMSIVIAGVMIAGSVIYMVGKLSGASPNLAGNKGEQLAAVGGQNNEVRDLRIEDRDVIMGDPKAKVSIIEYADYQCPFCGRFFTQTEQPLIDQYIKTGKAKMVYRNFAFLGPESTAAAEASECAKDQQKFWAFHDAIYNAEIADGQENNGNLKRDLFVRLAGDVGMDTKVFGQCFDSGKYKSKIQQDAVAAQTVGVNSTPTTFVNGEELRGALPFSDFQTAIEKYLK